MPEQAIIDQAFLLAVMFTLIAVVIAARTRKPIVAPLLRVWAWSDAFIAASIAGYGVSIFGVGQRFPPPPNAIPGILLILVAATIIGIIIGVVFALVPTILLSPFRGAREAVPQFFEQWYAAIGILMFVGGFVAGQISLAHYGPLQL